MNENISINLRTEDFKRQLYSLVNNSKLPISNIYFCFQLVGAEIEKIYIEELQKEQQALTEQQAAEANQPPVETSEEAE